jgi:hypothetical protein
MEEVRVPGTRIAWRGIDGWLAAVRRLEAGPVRASAAHYRREAALMASLTEAHLRACEDPESLADFEAFMRRARRRSGGLCFDPTRGLGRARIGTFIVLAEGLRRRIEVGDPARKKGPRFDPTRIPDGRLEILIQSHADAAVVERLRGERRRRAGFDGPTSENA